MDNVKDNSYISAVEILEKAQNNRTNYFKQEQKKTGFWDNLFKPFKCGNANNI